MSNRSDLSQSFLAGTDWAHAERKSLAGDASSRRYERLVLPDSQTAILMDAPPDNGEDVRPFVSIASHLDGLGLSAPRILKTDPTHGFLLLEDLGDDLFARVVQREPSQELSLYRAATDVLIELHKTPPPQGLTKMDVATLADMVEPLFSWYLAAVSNHWQEIWHRFHALFLAELESHLPPPSVLVLRDFHAENLLWLPARNDHKKVGLLDFQDALIGHCAYDLVSLLQDARRNVAVSTEQEIKAYFASKTGADAEAFDCSYRLLGAQRNLRIIGVFARLCLHYGKPHYVDMIPHVYDLAMRNLAHPSLTRPAAILAEHLPPPTPAFLQKLKDQCATRPLQ